MIFVVYNLKEKIIMKKSKIIIPALGLIALGTAASITGTVAWFSMNTQVTATGMQVVAKSDNTFLLIGTGSNNTAALIQAANPNETVALTVSDEDAQLYPCKPVQTAEEAALLNTTTGKKVGEGAITVAGAIVSNAATADAVTNWYTATAATSAASTMKEGSARQLTSFEHYVIKKTVYLTVSVGANPANNLKVTADIAQKDGGTDIAACKMVVTTDDSGFAFVNNSNKTNVDIKGTNTDITATTVRTVNIYIYYDGSESVVYTNNAVNLKGATIDLTFTVDSHPAA